MSYKHGGTFCLICCPVCYSIWERIITDRYGICPYCGEKIDLYRAIAK